MSTESEWNVALIVAYKRKRLQELLGEGLTRSEAMSIIRPELDEKRFLLKKEREEESEDEDYEEVEEDDFEEENEY
jgi:uncharacterized protein YoaH (UPF0181 family)